MLIENYKQSIQSNINVSDIQTYKNLPSSSSSSEVSSLSELLSLISDAALSCIGFIVIVRAESSQSKASAVTLNDSCSSLPLFKRTIEIPTKSITKKTQMAIIKIVEWELWAVEREGMYLLLNQSFCCKTLKAIILIFF